MKYSYIVVVNGKPESGKTTFEQECRRYLKTKDVRCYIMSSIDFIKDIYTMLGWNGIKTDKARKDLSTLKKMWIDNCNGPINYIIKSAIELSNDSPCIIFTDIREESEIENLMGNVDALEPTGIKLTTVFINRPDNDGMEYGNKSDDMVGTNMSLYNYVISNSGDINKLCEQSEKFINILMEV